MDLEKLRALFDLLVEKDIAEFEHEEDGVRVVVSRGSRFGVAPGSPSSTGVIAPMAHSLAPPFVAPTSGPASEPGGGSVDVTSPFVGSFYRSPSPDVPA